MDGSTEGTVRHAFISYVKQDRERAINLKQALEAAGITAWLDKERLWPGQDWKIEIRRAIQEGSMAFLACFSENSAARETTYQNEELLTAVEEYRLRAPGKQWLFPIRFSDVNPPPFDLGAGRNLNSLQFTDLFGPAELTEFARLTGSLSAILNPKLTAGTAATFHLPTEGIEGQQALERTIKTLLRDPNGDIALEETVLQVAGTLRQALNDEERFPMGFVPEERGSGLAWATRLRDTLTGYESVTKELGAVFRLAGLYGQPIHEQIWSSAMSAVASDAFRGNGHRLLLDARGYPLLILQYVAALSALPRRNFGVIRAISVEPMVRGLNEKTSAVNFANVSSLEGDLSWLYSATTIAMQSRADALTEERVEGYRLKTIGNRYTPLSDHLNELLWPFFQSRFLDKREFDDAFDDVEVFLDALAADEQERNRSYGRSWIGAGRYTWRNRYGETPEKRLQESLEQEGANWKPLQAGLFGGNLDRATTAVATLVATAERLRHELSFR